MEAKIIERFERSRERARSPQIEEPASPQVKGSSTKCRVKFGPVSERTYVKNLEDVSENRTDTHIESHRESAEWSSYLNEHQYLLTSPVPLLRMYHDQAIADNDTVAVTVIRCIIDMKKKN